MSPLSPFLGITELVLGYGLLGLQPLTDIMNFHPGSSHPDAEVAYWKKTLALGTTGPLTSNYLESKLPMERLRKNEPVGRAVPFLDYLKLWSFREWLGNCLPPCVNTYAICQSECTRDLLVASWRPLVPLAWQLDKIFRIGVLYKDAEIPVPFSFLPLG